MSINRELAMHHKHQRLQSFPLNNLPISGLQVSGNFKIELAMAILSEENQKSECQDMQQSYR